MRVLADYLPKFIAAGFSAEIDGESFLVFCGAPSGNLFILSIPAATLVDLHREAQDTLSGFPAVNGPTIQYFYRCTQSEKSRQLTEDIKLHGDGDRVATFPGSSYDPPIGTLRQIPVLSWKEHCDLIASILAPVQAPDPDVSVFQNMKINEDNVALMFQHEFGDELRYCDQWGQWLRWNRAKWEPERTLLAFHYCRELTRRANAASAVHAATKASFAKGVEFFVKTSRQFATVSGDWDRDSWLLNHPSGTTNLQTSEMRRHVKTDYITKCCRVSPAPGKRPVFDMFLRDICLNDEGLINYHQRSLGACLSGAIQDNFLMFWHGSGQNGKNTFGDLITWLLGGYSKVIPIDTLLSNTRGANHPTTLANLRGLRLAVCSEVSEGSYWDEARVKSLTGDTEISARFMRQDFFEFTRTHKHLVYGNHRPLLRIVDPGMEARLHIVPFRAYFPPDARDPNMRQKLQAEAPQILNWLIEGHAQWLEDGYLKKCSAVQAETELYFESQSTNDAWLAECVVQGDDRACSARDLYANFSVWKEARGEGVISQTRWGEWITQRGYEKYLLHGRIMYKGLDLRPLSVLGL